MNYLIWSNQHQQWWRPGKAGYTGYVEEAGRYSEDEAKTIVRDATLDGRLLHSRIDPSSGKPYDQFDEVMVLAPEEIDA